MIFVFFKTQYFDYGHCQKPQVKWPPHASSHRMGSERLSPSLEGACHDTAMSGFTLLELLIGLAILSMISLGLVTATRQVINSKDLIQNQDDQQQAVMSTLDRMYWDLNMAFFTQSRDFLGAKFEGQLGFVGSNDRLDFLSFSHLRYLAAAKESEATEISYYLAPSQENRDHQVLMRRASPKIDQDLKEGGKAYALLEGVEALEFRYLPFGEDKEYKRAWDTDSLDYAGRLPWAVEASLRVFFPEEEEPREFKLLVPLKFQQPLKF